MRNKVSSKIFYRPNIKILPWKQLLLSSLLTIIVAIVIVAIGVFLTSALSSILFGNPNAFANSYPAFAGTWQIVSLISYGALGVYIFECLYPKTRLTKNSLWAMLVCLTFSGWLGISLMIQQPLRLPACGVPLVLVATGIFVKGRPYWR